MSMMRTFAAVAFVVATLCISQSSYAQTTTNAENPCVCWIDAKTGKPVPTVPLSGINLIGVQAEGAGVQAGVALMDDPHADHASNPKTGQTFVRVPCPPQTATTTPPPAPGTTGMGFTPSFQIRGFGGATFVNGNTPSTAGFEWVDSSIVKTIGGGPPPSTFINQSVSLRTGNFGGRVNVPFYGFELGVHGGATVAGSTITQATGFCGPTSTGPSGACTIVSSSTTHDTVVGPFVGGYILTRFFLT